MEDMAIKYQARLMILKRNITSLNELGINTTDYFNTMKNIEAEVEKKVKESSTVNDFGTFLQDLIGMIYANAANDIDKINDHIVSEYETYYQIKITCEQLDQNMKRIDHTNLDQLTKKTLELLNCLRNSTTINYDSEKVLVESVYNLVYKMIKTELSYRSNSLLLDHIRSSETDSVYLSELIRKEILNLNKKDKTNELLDQIQEAKKKSFDSHSFLDENLIAMLNQDSEYEFIKETRDQFLKKYAQYMNKNKKYSTIREQYIDCLSSLDRLNEKLKKHQLSYLKKKVISLANLGLLGLCMLGSAIILKETTKKIEYETVTTTYDSSSDSTYSETDFQGYTSDSLTLTEYLPWEEPGYFRKLYKRDVYHYDLSKIGITYDELENYITPAINDKISVKEKETETLSDKPDDYDNKSKYVVTKVVQNEDVTRKVDRPFCWLFCTILCELEIVKTYRNRGSKRKKISRKKLNKIKDIKGEIKKKNEEYLTLSTKLDSLKSEEIYLKKQLRHEYDQLPIMLQKDKDIKQKVLTLK